MQAKQGNIKHTLDPSNPLMLKKRQNKKYKGFKDFLLNKLKTDSLKK